MENTCIRLYATTINNFRFNRVIRTPEAAEFAINELQTKLAATDAGQRRINDVRYSSLRMKISLRARYDSFLETKTYYLRCEAHCKDAVEELRQKLQQMMTVPGSTEETKAKPSHELVHPGPNPESTSGNDWSVLEWETSQIRRDVEEIDNVSALLHQYLLNELDGNKHDARTKALCSHIFNINDMIVRRSGQIMESLKIINVWPEGKALAA